MRNADSTSVVETPRAVGERVALEARRAGKGIRAIVRRCHAHSLSSRFGLLGTRQDRLLNPRFGLVRIVTRVPSRPEDLPP